MAVPAPKTELLRSLGRLVRGLSSLFWGLPLTLVLCVQTARTGWPGGIFGVLPPILTTGLLLFGLWQLGSFQKQERPWRAALDRAMLLALVNFWLSPFLYWWALQPDQVFFTCVVAVLALSGLFFLLNLNFVIQRLGEMLPDETLRSETRHYTALNRSLLALLLVIIAATILAARLVPLLHSKPSLPVNPSALVLSIPALGLQLNGVWVFWFVLLLLLLLPLAMTMALLWKTKEVILDSVFSADP